jgi:AraC-like DNA-binding protein
MYRERRSSLPGAVVWHRVTEPGEAVRVLPDGCQDLLWVDGELLVAGPDTRAWVASAPTGTSYVGLRFAPGTGTAVLGAPARALRDQRVPLTDLWPAGQVRRAAGKVARADSPGTALEEIARDRLRGTRWPDPAIAAVVSRLRAGASVAGTAGLLGSGQRLLHRRSLEVFGYGPKTLARILRLNRAVDLARAGTPFATVAAATGYADQAHLAREVKAMAGVTLTTLVGGP